MFCSVLLPRLGQRGRDRARGAEQMDKKSHDETAHEERPAKEACAATSEIRDFKKRGVFTEVPYATAAERACRRPIPVKWVDVQETEGQCRSRLVAKEIRT